MFTDRVEAMWSDARGLMLELPTNFPLNITLWEVGGRLSGKLGSAGLSWLNDYVVIR